jgi:hypothetical protein
MKNKGISNKNNSIEEGKVKNYMNLADHYQRAPLL